MDGRRWLIYEYFFDKIFPSRVAADSYKKAVDSAILKLRNLESNHVGEVTESPCSPETPIELAIDFILHDFEMAEVEPISTYVDFGESEFLVADERGLQVSTKEAAERGAFSVRGILKNDGIPGLYRGFGTVITGAVPARIIFFTASDTTKIAAFKIVEPLKLSESSQAALASGVAGMTASLCSQGVFVPIDVVSQKLMVQGYSGHAKYNGGFDVARKILKSDGIRGFYRGFGLSVLTYAPSSAVWWASYGSSQRVIWRLLGNGSDGEGVPPSSSKIVLVQATGGIIAGASASFITTPLDTIKTRLQVMGQEKRSSARQVVKNLIKDDGWTGFYRGIGPRFFSMSAWGTSMILAYEYLKRSCAKEV